VLLIGAPGHECACRICHCACRIRTGKTDSTASPDGGGFETISTLVRLFSMGLQRTHWHGSVYDSRESVVGHEIT